MTSDCEGGAGQQAKFCVRQSCSLLRCEPDGEGGRRRDQSAVQRYSWLAGDGCAGGKASLGRHRGPVGLDLNPSRSNAGRLIYNGGRDAEVFVLMWEVCSVA